MVCPPINENTNTNTNIIKWGGERKLANQMTCLVINKNTKQIQIQIHDVSKPNGQSSQQGSQSKNFSPNTVNNAYS